MAIRPKIGLALGSGGARGWCHIGVLRALAEIGVIPDMVAGTSIGALVGAAWAGGKLDELEAWVRALTARRFVSLMDVSLGSGGLVEARKIEALLEQLELSERIETLERPFCAVATDMETGREIWLKRGPTYRAVRASAGIPGVMSPIEHEGRWLLDGGLTNPVPVSAARALGAEVVIAVNPNGRPYGRIWSPPEPKQPASGWSSYLTETLQQRLGWPADARQKSPQPNYFDVLNAAIEVMEDTIRRARLAGDPPHVQLSANLPNLNVLELYRGAEAIEEGRRIVFAQEALIREVCELPDA